MGRFDFISPGAAASGALKQFLVEQEAQKRQMMLDEITRQNQQIALGREARLAESTDAQIANTKANTQSLIEQRNATKALNEQTLRDKVSARYLPGDVVDAGDEALVTGTAQQTLPGRSIAMTTAAPGIGPQAETVSGSAPEAPAPMVPGVVMDQQATGRKIALGTPEQRQAAAQKKQMEAVIASLPTEQQARARAIVASGGKLDGKDIIPERKVHSLGVGGKLVAEMPDGSVETIAEGREPAGKTLSPTSEAAIINRLQVQWDKSNSAAREMNRQFNLMTTGLNRYEADPIGGSQAVLVTFQKILDPISVVRESEYARSPQGLALLDRMQGFVERLAKGGAGVPKEELAAMVETAKQFKQNTADSLPGLRARSTRVAGRYGIPTDLIFDDVDGSESGVNPPPPPPPAAASVAAPPPAASPAAPPAAGTTFIRVNGKLVPAPAGK